MSHTPFPWTIDRSGGGSPSIHGAGGQLVAVLGYREHEPTPNAEEDGHIIAAAPDLLQFAEELISDLDGEELPGSTIDTKNLLLDAIRKARGES